MEERSIQKINTNSIAGEHRSFIFQMLIQVDCFSDNCGTPIFMEGHEFASLGVQDWWGP
jgi:hypothetical protein